jgi:hypothetical protein
MPSGTPRTPRVLAYASSGKRAFRRTAGADEESAPVALSDPHDASAEEKHAAELRCIEVLRRRRDAREGGRRRSAGVGQLPR